MKSIVQCTYESGGEYTSVLLPDHYRDKATFTPMTTTQSAPEGNNSEPLIISRPIGEPGRKTGRAGYNLEERSLLTSQEMKCLRVWY